jgi:hypothetical protein
LAPARLFHVLILEVLKAQKQLGEAEQETTANVTLLEGCEKINVIPTPNKVTQTKSNARKSHGKWSLQ